MKSRYLTELKEAYWQFENQWTDDKKSTFRDFIVWLEENLV